MVLPPESVRLRRRNFRAIAQSAADLSVVMLLNGVPTSILSLSFIGAKSLNVELEKALKNVETLLDQKIPTLTEVSAKMAETKGANYVVIGT